MNKTINPLSEVKKRDLHFECQKEIIQEIYLTSKWDGIKCPTCGITQGFPYKGWDKYYCKHIENRVNRKMRKMNLKSQELLKDILKLDFGKGE